MRQYLETKWEYYWVPAVRSAAFSLAVDKSIVNRNRSANSVIEEVVNEVRDGFVAYVTSVHQNYAYYTKANSFFDEEKRRDISEQVFNALQNWRKSNGE